MAKKRILDLSSNLTALLALLSSVIIAFFAAILYIGQFLPVYTDETLWKIFGSRLFLDRGQLIYSFAECKSGFLLPPPITWVPAAVWDSFLYQDMSDPIKHRYFGIVSCLVLFAVLTFGLRKVSRLNWLICLGTVICFLSLGTLPFLLLMNRPEKSMILLMTIAVLIPIVLNKSINFDFKKRFFWTLIYLLISFSTIAVHPIGILFLFPIVLAYGFLVRSWQFTIVFLTGIFFSLFETVQLWHKRTNCPESPWLTQLLESFTLKPQQFFSKPLEFIKSGLINLSRSNEYMRNTQFKIEYQSQWLPGVQWPLSAFDQLLNVLLYVPIFVSIFFIVYQILPFGKSKYNCKNLYLTLSIVILISSIMFLQNLKNFYEAGLVLPLFLIALIFSFKISFTEKFLPFFKCLLVLCLLIGILEDGNLFFRFYSSALNEWQAHAASFQKSREQVDHLVFNACGFSRDEKMSHLILDELSYTVLWRSYAPMFSHSFFGWWATGTDYKETIKQTHPHGIVVGCQNLPPGLLMRTVNEAGMCCIKFKEPYTTYDQF